MKYAITKPNIEPIKNFFVFSIARTASKNSLNQEKKVINATAKITPGKA